MRRVFQSFEDEEIEDINKAIKKELNKINFQEKITPGMKIGITAGSRGIDNVKDIIKSIIKEVKNSGGKPFIIPAMGSHGGGTVQGQLNVLAKLGITEKEMNVPIKSTMETIKLREFKNGLPVHFDKIAYECDGIVVVNRIKVHTAYKGEIESGLLKMLAVGLGNHEGARQVHSLGVRGLKKYIKKFAHVILQKAPILCGIGIIENAYEKTHTIKAANPDEFETIEKKLLKWCKDLLPSLPAKKIDLLIIEEMGKDISGTGMDTNIVGGIKGSIDGGFSPPEVQKIMVLDLTEESNGNAMGIGIADLTTQNVYEKIDFETTYTNAITSTFFDRASIPMVFKTEKEGVEAALEALWKFPGEKPKVIIIKNTLNLEELYVSEAVWEEIKNKNNVETKGDWHSLDFDAGGKINLKI